MLSPLAYRVLECGITIQQIPAPTFKETQRAEYMQQQFEAEGLCDIGMDRLGNVYARLPGAQNERVLVVSAHLDTVFSHSTDLHLTRSVDKICGPGIGDNSLGLAGLFGLVWGLQAKKTTLPGDVWLVANVCEEGLGDLRGMRAVVDRFGSQALAYLVLEGMAMGQIYHRGLGVQRYRIRAQTGGGHSWVDFGRPSAIHELAALVHRLLALPIPARPRTSLNVGVISGGTTVNTIAAEAYIELDLRSEGARALESLSGQVEALVRAANRSDVQMTAEVIGQRPAGKIPATHPLVRLAERSLQAQGVRPNLGIGSTDANIPLSQGLPAICIGLSTGGGAHTLQEYVNISPLTQGLQALIAVVHGAFHEMTSI